MHRNDKFFETMLRNGSDKSGVHIAWEHQCLCVHLPESPVLGCSPSRYNLCDEDRRVVPDVRIISATCDTEPQT